jgi:hypothetical protein
MLETSKFVDINVAYCFFLSVYELNFFFFFFFLKKKIIDIIDNQSNYKSRMLL